MDARAQVDRPLAVVDAVNTASPVTWWVHPDHLNRPVLMTDAAKAQVWQAVWKPFGEAQSLTGPAALDTRFPGQWFQIESGLHYNWHRHYDPTTGRYTQPDPLGFVDGPGVYNYANQSPLLLLDKLGLWSINISLYYPFRGTVQLGSSDGTWWASFNGGVGAEAGFDFDPDQQLPVSKCIKPGVYSALNFNVGAGVSVGPFSAGGEDMGVGVWVLGKSELTGACGCSTVKGGVGARSEGSYNTFSFRRRDWNWKNFKRGKPGVGIGGSASGGITFIWK